MITWIIYLKMVLGVESYEEVYQQTLDKKSRISSNTGRHYLSK